MKNLSIRIFSVVAVVLVAAWQWATVAANYHGNWTALFCTGALQTHPPLVTSERVYLFANSTGYDGQMYHYVAHDPFMRSDLKNYVDDPRLRYRRILIPLLAYTLAGGREAWIDPACELVFLASIGLGVYWSCLFVRSMEFPPVWGLLFLLMPAIPISADRLVIDSGLAALTMAFLCWSRAPSSKLFVVLLCAALTRETGLLLVAAYCASLVWTRQFRCAAIFALSAAPALAWFGYVKTQTVGHSYGLSPWPFSAILRVLLTAVVYPDGTPFAALVHGADYLALAGVLIGFVFSFLFFANNNVPTPLRFAAVLFATMGLVLQRTDHWQNVYDFGRVYTPMLLCLAAVAARFRRPLLLAPAAMMLPRIAMQLAPQVLGVFHG